jgi:2-isopropylmalate synthase
VTIDELVYDWNTIEPSLVAPNRHIGIDDETLRDGLQSPSVTEPPVEQKLELLHLMEALNIDTANIGLPGAGGTHAAGVERLAREIADKKLKIRPNCAARTHRNDITAVLEISQRAGIPIEACTFIGSSSVRFFAEDWTLDKLLQMTEEAVSFAVGQGLPVNPRQSRNDSRALLDCDSLRRESGLRLRYGWTFNARRRAFSREVRQKHY